MHTTDETLAKQNKILMDQTDLKLYATVFDHQKVLTSPQSVIGSFYDGKKFDHTISLLMVLSKNKNIVSCGVSLVVKVIPMNCNVLIEIG